MKLTSVVSFFALAAITGVGHAAWDHSHGDSANTGFVKQVTDPAVSPMQAVQVGDLAPGAGPVTGPDGTVYVGNLYGQVLAFHVNGTPYWSRQLPPGQWVTASPVVGADGSVYVVAETRFLIQGKTSEYRYESTLHKFTASGGWLYQAPFPQRWKGTRYSSRGDANAQPNIWQFNGSEAIVVPAVYGIPGYMSLRLIAFSTSGAVLGDNLVWTPAAGTVTGEGGWFELLDITAGFQGAGPPPCPDCLTAEMGWLPAVAVWQKSKGDAPNIMVTNAMQDTVGYSFDPSHGFTELFRVHDARRGLASAPVVLPDGHTVVGTGDFDVNGVLDGGRLTFAGPNFMPLTDATGPLSPITAAPTRLADGRLIAIDRRAQLFEFSNNNVLTKKIALQQDLPPTFTSESIASAAATCNFVYAASTHAFKTFNAKTLAQVASFSWSFGGRSSPAVGPAGHVYAVANNTLFVFPPPPRPALSFAGTTCDMSTSVNFTFGNLGVGGLSLGR